MRIGADIAERLLSLAADVVRLVERLPKRAAARHVGFQLVRSATGGGANYEEARAAESRDDFIHKIGVAAKEVRETVYWLDLITRMAWSKDAPELASRARDLSAILAASARTARNNARLSPSV